MLLGQKKAIGSLLAEFDSYVSLRSIESDRNCRTSNKS